MSGAAPTGGDAAAERAIAEVGPLRDLNYESYLKVPELLSLQRLISEPRHHDEMLFIVVHQAFELWFKLVLHETDALNRAFTDLNVARAHKVLKRLFKIQDVLLRQIHTLASLAPDEFGEFRDRLRPASGFQSVQFREIEFRWGLKDARFLAFFERLPEAQARLRAALDAPSVYDCLLRYLAQCGHAIPANVLDREPRLPHAPDDGVRAVFLEIYRNAEAFYRDYVLCEEMIDLDANFALWRYHHVTMVERTIGRRRGTGGSSGAEYLRKTLHKRFFPELWEVRTLLGGEYG